MMVKMIIGNPYKFSIFTEKMQFGGYYYDQKSGLPESIFWANYWGEEIIDRFKANNIDIKSIQNQVYQLEEINAY